MMDQRMIDDLSDVLQGRNSEHREYPFGHPKHRPPAGALLPYVHGTGSTLTVDFGSARECKRFFDIFKTLGKDARERTIEHLKEFGTITQAN